MYTLTSFLFSLFYNALSRRSGRSDPTGIHSSNVTCRCVCLSPQPVSGRGHRHRSQSRRRDGVGLSVLSHGRSAAPAPDPAAATGALHRSQITLTATLK